MTVRQLTWRSKLSVPKGAAVEHENRAGCNTATRQAQHDTRRRRIATQLALHWGIKVQITYDLSALKFLLLYIYLSAKCTIFLGIEIDFDFCFSKGLFFLSPQILFFTRTPSKENAHPPCLGYIHMKEPRSLVFSEPEIKNIDSYRRKKKKRKEISDPRS